MSNRHDIEPLLRIALRAPLTTDLVHEYLSPTSRDGVEPRILQGLEDIAVGHPGDLMKTEDLWRRKTVQMDTVARFELSEEVGVPLEGEIRVQPSLHQNTASTELDGLFDLAVDILVAQHVALVVTRRSVERAEITDARADVRVVDVASDDVADETVRVKTRP